MQYKHLTDYSNPAEVRKHEDRLAKRLARYGFRMSKGVTLGPAAQHLQLKREPKARGYKITNAATGAVIDGARFDLTLDQVEEFWLQEYTTRQQAKAKEKMKRLLSNKSA
jgi:hypothetical protein